MASKKNFDISAWRERPYLGAHSLANMPGKKMVVEIADAKPEDVVGVKGKKSGRAVLYFRNFEKGMIVNSTAEKTLRKLFGSTETDDLIGQKVGLFATSCRYADGTVGPCLRIHDQRVDGKEPVGAARAREVDAEEENPETRSQQEEAAAMPSDSPSTGDENK